MKRYLTFFSSPVVIGLIFSFSSIDAQQHDIDSLHRLLKTAPEDSNRASALNYLSYLVEQTGNYSKSDSLAQQALQLSQKVNYKKGIARAYNNIGNNYEDKGDYKNALEYYDKALDIKRQMGDRHGIETTLNDIGHIYEGQGNYGLAIKNFSEAVKICEEIGDKQGKANALGNIGDTYLQQSDFPKALDNDFDALKIYEQILDTDDIATSYVGIGNCYNRQGDYSKALDYYTKALQIKKKSGDKPAIADLYSNIGLIYQQQNNFPNALEQYYKALIIDQEIGNALGTANCYHNIGDNFMHQKKYDQAIDNCLKGLDILKKIGDKEGIARSLQEIGACYSFQKKYKEAIDYENQARDLALDIGALEIMRTAIEKLSSIYESTGDLKNALLYYKKSTALKDSIYNSENSKKTVATELNFKFEQQQAKEKAEQEKKDAVAVAESKRQRIVIIFVIIIALAIGVIAIIIFRSLRTTRQQKTLIEQQKGLVEEKNKEILDSINYAKRLQDAILPPLSLIKQYLPESFVLYKPKDIVAGDFYWMERAGDKILIAAADCTGHGVPGAMVSVVCSNALNRTVKEFHITEPGKILDKVLELVLETFEKSEDNVQDGMDISLASITPSEGGIQLQWAGAYNSLVYMLNGEMKELAADKQPIGKTDNPKPFTTHTIKFPPNRADERRLLYLFTDGYADQFGGPKGKKFKYKQLQEKLLAISHQPLAEQKQLLEQKFKDWKGELEQVDDVLIIGIRV